jgi:hypothetical protein
MIELLPGLRRFRGLIVACVERQFASRHLEMSLDFPGRIVRRLAPMADASGRVRARDVFRTSGAPVAPRLSNP